jgi:hypothetical protein
MVPPGEAIPPEQGSPGARGPADIQQVTADLQLQLESILRIAGELMTLLAALREWEEYFAKQHDSWSDACDSSGKPLQ